MDPMRSNRSNMALRALNGMKKGMEKGLQEGLQEGLQKGKAEGKAEGRQEEKHSIALNLKKLGVSIEQIAFATGLSIEEIEKL